MGNIDRSRRNTNATQALNEFHFGFWFVNHPIEIAFFVGFKSYPAIRGICNSCITTLLFSLLFFLRGSGIPGMRDGCFTADMLDRTSAQRVIETITTTSTLTFACYYEIEKRDVILLPSEATNGRRGCTKGDSKATVPLGGARRTSPHLSSRHGAPSPKHSIIMRTSYVITANPLNLRTSFPAGCLSPRSSKGGEGRPCSRALCFAQPHLGRGHIRRRRATHSACLSAIATRGPGTVSSFT